MNELIAPEAAVLLVTTALIVVVVLRTRSVRRRLTQFLAPRGFSPEANPPELSFDSRKLHVAQAFSGQLAPGVKGHFMSCYDRGVARRVKFYLGALVPDSVADAEQRLGGADFVSRQPGGLLALWESKDSPEDAARVLAKVEAALK